jgi:hypothetical protein
MRVDGKGNPPKSLAFDNMTDRPIKGTTDWKEYQVVLDVAGDAEGLCFGVLNTGAGTLWMSDIRFEPVGKDVPVTPAPAQASPKPKPKTKPENLGFDK